MPPAKKAAARKPAAKKAAPKAVDLSHLIPPKELADEFVSRTIDGYLDLDILEYAQANQRNVLLYGPTGPGKTSLIYAYAAKMGQPIAMLPCNGAIDPQMALGAYVMRADGTVEWADANLINICRFGGVIDLDEVNFMPPKYLSVFHSALDGRREIVLPDKQGEVIKLHENTLICATYNPRYEGTRPLNPAFRNRWHIKLEYGYDEVVEAELVPSPALLQVANALRSSADAGDLETPISTNMLIEFIQFAFDLSYEFAVRNFLNAFNDEERDAVRNRIELSQADIIDDIHALAAAEGITLDW